MLLLEKRLKATTSSSGVFSSLDFVQHFKKLLT